MTPTERTALMPTMPVNVKEAIKGNTVLRK